MHVVSSICQIRISVFRVNRSKFLSKRSALIEGEPNVVLFDGLPILFTGKNKLGNYIIGTSVRDDRKPSIERYFHVVTSPSEYRRFHAGFVSYLDLLREADPIYVVDRVGKSRKEQVGTIEFSDIPPQYLPTEHSYLPTHLHKPVLVDVDKGEYAALDADDFRPTVPTSNQQMTETNKESEPQP